MSFHSAPQDMDSYSYYPQQYSHVNPSYSASFQQQDLSQYTSYDPFQPQSYSTQNLPPVAHVLGNSQNYSPSYIPTDPPSPSSIHDPSSGTSRSSYSRTGSIVPPLEKTFICPMCSAAFARNHDLTRHQKGHDNTKAYKCAGCSKSFTRKDALKRHATQKSCGGEYNAKTVQVVSIDHNTSSSMPSSPSASTPPHSGTFNMTMPSPIHCTNSSDSDSGTPYPVSYSYQHQPQHHHQHHHQHQRY